MVPFALKSHPLHGRLGSQPTPYGCKQFSAATGIAERLAALKRGARVCASSAIEAVADLIALSSNESGIFATNASAQRCLWLPLALAHVAASARVNEVLLEMGVIGVVAYSCPSLKPATAKGRVGAAIREAGDANVWFLLVCVEKAEGRFHDTETSMQSVMDWFGGLGAIRGEFHGWKFFDRSLGVGASGSVKLMRRQSGGEPRPLPRDTLNACVAAKVVSLDASNDAMLNEASLFIQAQQHPNIARMLGIVCVELKSSKQLSWHLLMEAHLGGDLQNRVAEQGGPLPLKDGIRIIRDVLQGLCHIHSRCILHRDVKPENAVLAGDDRAVLIDFGIACHASQKCELLNRRGTPGYVAPELFLGEPFSPKADVFSSGAVAYFALGGRSAFRGASVDAILKANKEAVVRF